MSLPAENSQAQTETKQNDKEYNFAQLRKQLEQEKQARSAVEQRLEAMEQGLQVRKQEYDDDGDSDDPYINRKTLKKELSKWGSDLDKKIDKKAEEKARVLVEQERQNNFLRQNADFHNILTPDLIQKFAEQHPEIAEPMLEMPDNFARQKLLYQNIKALGLHKPPPPKEDIQKKIDANRRSPYYQPSQAGATPPYAQQSDFSESGQKNAYAKMRELINNRKALG
jgi:hypothetical protein